MIGYAISFVCGAAGMLALLVMISMSIDDNEMTHGKRGQVSK